MSGQDPVVARVVATLRKVELPSLDAAARARIRRRVLAAATTQES